MSDFSNYAENAVCNHLFRNSALTSPTTVYLAVFTAVSDAEAGTGTEASGGSYARVAITFGAPSNGVITNSSTVTFGTGWSGTVTHAAIYDASTSGNALTSIKALGSSIVIGTSDVLEFTSGQISFTVA